MWGMIIVNTILTALYSNYNRIVIIFHRKLKFKNILEDMKSTSSTEDKAIKLWGVTISFLFMVLILTLTEIIPIITEGKVLYLIIYSIFLMVVIGKIPNDDSTHKIGILTVQHKLLLEPITDLFFVLILWILHDLAFKSHPEFNVIYYGLSTVLSLILGSLNVAELYIYLKSGPSKELNVYIFFIIFPLLMVQSFIVPFEEAFFYSNYVIVMLKIILLHISYIIFLIRFGSKDLSIWTFVWCWMCFASVYLIFIFMFQMMLALTFENIMVNKSSSVLLTSPQSQLGVDNSDETTILTNIENGNVTNRMNSGIPRNNHSSSNVNSNAFDIIGLNNSVNKQDNVNNNNNNNSVDIRYQKARLLFPAIDKQN